MNNAERIRSMTDEELAKYLILNQQYAMYEVTNALTGNGPDPTIIGASDLVDRLDWLKKPYEEDT